MSKPSKRDMLLHSVSLQVAAIFHTISVEDMSEDIKDDLITAYRCLRRHITIAPDGKRYGATEGYRAMQGDI